VKVAERRSDPVLENLAASFEGSIAYEEDLAAEDLTRSLLNGRTYGDVVADRGPWDLVLSDRRRLPVTEIGADYVAAHGVALVLCRYGARPLVRGSSTPPTSAQKTFAMVLREWSRSGQKVGVTSGDATWEGSVVSASPDHLLLLSNGREVLLTPTMIDHVTVSREG